MALPPLQGSAHLPLPQINLYSDPPQPSRSIHTGTVPQGTKVLSFTIPQPHSAEWRPGPAKEPRASESEGESGKEAEAAGLLLWLHSGSRGRPGQAEVERALREAGAPGGL